MTETRRTSLAEARRARAVTPETEEEYVAAQLRYALGEAVRRQRLDLGPSQQELGRRAGTTQSAVARFEGGGTVPTIPLLDRLARALGLELKVEPAPQTKRLTPAVTGRRFTLGHGPRAAAAPCRYGRPGRRPLPHESLGRKALALQAARRPRAAGSAATKHA